MKTCRIFILCTLTIFLYTGCGEEPKENSPEAIKNPVDTYLDTRVNAIDMAKQSLKESNKRTKEQDKTMESLIK